MRNLKNTLAVLLTLFTLVVGSPQAWADKVAIEPIKYYGYPLPYQVADLDEYANNMATAWQQTYDKCMAAAQGEYYWHCQKYRVVGKAPADYNSGFTNGEPNTYKLFFERDVDEKNYAGHFVYTEATADGGGRSRSALPRWLSPPVSMP